MSETPLSRPQQALMLAGMLVLVLAVFGAARIGIADFASMDARARLDRALASGERLSPAEWVRLRDALTDAANANPDDPQAWERLGSFYLQRAGGPRANAEFARPYYRSALVNLRRAAGMRPTSPYTQANIVVAKHALDEFDDEFQRAMLNAAEHGRFEPAVLSVLLEVGVARWEQLSPRLQNTVTAAAERALASEPKPTVAAARQAGYLPWLCARFRERIEAECAPALRAPAS